jgi:DHA2 family multidrug resistance protein
MLQTEAASVVWNVTLPSGIAALNEEVTRQASIIAYTNDFKLLFYLALSGLVLILLMRPSSPA